MVGFYFYLFWYTYRNPACTPDRAEYFMIGDSLPFDLHSLNKLI
jgi:hypothetical protein